MPFPANPKQRGDLVLRFDIEFPVYMSISNKNLVKKAFKVSCTNIGDAEYINRLILANKMRRNVDEDVPLRRDTKTNKKQID